ncbi:MAG: hypothetical protein BRD49_03265 [Bacteroidetes bacterium SW_10_40_5]|nr:MAG: hypothetical protein BRD49_03265 [Bacteroidetes bacterium SW_10_40_5]
MKRLLHASQKILGKALDKARINLIADQISGFKLFKVGFLTLLFFFLFSVNDVNAQCPVYSENFNGGIPSNWVIVSNSGAISTSNCFGTNNPQLEIEGVDGTIIETQPIDLSSFSSVTISYDYREGDSNCGESADQGDNIDVDYWDGSQWVNLTNYDGSSAPQTFTKDNFNLNTGLTSSFRLRFNYINGTGSGYDTYHFDNIDVLGTFTGTAFSGFTLPDTAFTGTPTLISNTTQPSAGDYEWYVNNSLVGTSYNLNYSPSSQGVDTIKLITSGCNHNDTITKYTNIVNPSTQPNPDFIVNKNVILPTTEVQFTDLSQNGATSWEWLIKPDDAGNYINPGGSPSNINSQNPNIQFQESGLYQVCLIATNSLGSDTLCKDDYVKVRETFDMCVNQTNSSKGEGILFDDGGQDNDYNDNQSCDFTINPCADEVILDFKSFDFNDAGDQIEVYDGSNSNGTLLASYNGNTNFGSAGFNSTLVAQSGTMYILYQTNSSGTASGFRADWSITPGTVAAPDAEVIGPDTTCSNIPNTFENISTGTNFDQYQWEVLGTNAIANKSDKSSFTHTFQSNGMQTVRLIASNDCGGSDTFDHDVMVTNVGTAPTAGFSSDIRKINPGVDTVHFKDTSSRCITSREWSFGPDAVEYVDGTDSLSANPSVKFLSDTVYDVTITATNALGTDQTIRPDYIEAIDYCRPGVGNTNPDIGISRFKVGDIDNSSNIGQASYTDYTSKSTVIERQDTLNMEVARNTTSNKMNRRIWIDYNQDGDFDDAGELIASEGPSKNLLWKPSYAVPANAQLGETRMRVGASFGSETVAPCSPISYGEYEDYKVMVKGDVTQPQITLMGPDTVMFEACDGSGKLSFGYTAMDNIDGNVTSQVIVNDNIVASQPGVYEKKYNVFDNAGNKAKEAVRTYIVTPDTTDPTINLIRGSQTELEVNTSLNVSAQYDAMDNCSGIASSSTVIDNQVVLGTYDVVYTVMDQAGNTVSKTQQVEVVDNTAPSAALSGSANMSVGVHSNFQDPGLDQISDNYWSRSNITINKQSNVDVDNIGTYEIEYEVTDGSGNETQIMRTVNVVDMLAPTITGTSYPAGATIDLDVNTRLDLNVSATDNYRNGNVTKQRTGSYFTDAIDNLGRANELGIYDAYYIFEDQSGNADSVMYEINVVDREAPDIELVESQSINLPRYQETPLANPDSGITVNGDNYYDRSEINVTTSGSYFDEYVAKNYGSAKFYEIIYQVEDPSGNESILKRDVNVITTGLGALNENKKGLKVSPNPAKDYLEIQIVNKREINSELVVYNTLGQKVKMIKQGDLAKGNYKINVSQWKSGVYFVQLKSEDQIKRKQVVIE